MEIVAIAALALALGFVIGLVAGARRALNLMMSGRGLRTASSRLARFMPETMPQRSAADILAGRVRVVLGGVTHDLPVLPRAASRRWVEQLDARFASLAASLGAATDTPQIMALLETQTDALYDMLLSYDQGGVLPSREEIDETATDAQILQAVLEVWRAAHPLAASVAEQTAARPTSTPSAAPSSSLPPPTAGAPSTSSPG